MDLNEKFIEALAVHAKYIKEIAEYVKETTEYLRNNLLADAKDVQAEKQRNYQHLVLILGYTAYFATWYQIREIFSKTLMGFSYGFMLLSILATVMSLMIPYFIRLIKNDFSIRIVYVRYFDIIALVFGFISILLIWLASFHWLLKYMCVCSCLQTA